MTVASKGPHYPATPAVWYEEGTYVDSVSAPRTPGFAVDPSVLKGHHAMIASQGPLLPNEQRAVDFQFRKRWKALLSVDDAIAGVANTLEELKLWDSTYFFITSDHGCTDAPSPVLPLLSLLTPWMICADNLGQHNLPSCKLNVYDHSIRIPMMIRGPGISPGRKFTQIGSNVDVAPTLLALAGLDPLDTTPQMDGKSLVPWLLTSAADALPSATAAQLATERARLRMPAEAVAPPKPVREAHCESSNGRGRHLAHAAV